MQQASSSISHSASRLRWLLCNAAAKPAVCWARAAARAGCSAALLGGCSAQRGVPGGSWSPLRSQQGSNSGWVPHSTATPRPTWHLSWNRPGMSNQNLRALLQRFGPRGTKAEGCTARPGSGPMGTCREAGQGWATELNELACNDSRVAHSKARVRPKGQLWWGFRPEVCRQGVATLLASSKSSLPTPLQQCCLPFPSPMQHCSVFLPMPMQHCSLPLPTLLQHCCLSLSSLLQNCSLPLPAPLQHCSLSYAKRAL